MGFINKTLARKQIREDAELLAEEKLYEYVGTEIESGTIRSGLWTKATTTASSSEHEDIKREYIRLRVEHLHAEGRLFNQFLEEVTEAEQSKRKTVKKSFMRSYRNARDRRIAIEKAEMEGQASPTGKFFLFITYLIIFGFVFIVVYAVMFL